MRRYLDDTVRQLPTSCLARYYTARSATATSRNAVLNQLIHPNLNSSWTTTPNQLKSSGYVLPFCCSPSFHSCMRSCSQMLPLALYPNGSVVSAASAATVKLRTRESTITIQDGSRPPVLHRQTITNTCADPCRLWLPCQTKTLPLKSRIVSSSPEDLNRLLVVRQPIVVQPIPEWRLVLVL